MGRIKTFHDGSHLDYGRGGFDDWCVYYTDRYGTWHAPLDKEYFKDLKDLGEKYGNERIYGDFLKVYERTGTEVNPAVLNMIDSIASAYGRSSLKFNVDLTTLYMGMIAENNKDRAILKKKIKRLGVHCVLMEGMDYIKAASFMRGTYWRVLDRMCRERGF